MELDRPGPSYTVDPLEQVHAAAPDAQLWFVMGADQLLAFATWHGLRHRRISLWHRDAIPWAEIGQRVGQSNLSTTADTYTHVIVGEEVNHTEWVPSSG